MRADDQYCFGDARLEAALDQRRFGALGIAHLTSEPQRQQYCDQDCGDLQERRRREQRLELAARISQQFLHRRWRLLFMR